MSKQILLKAMKMTVMRETDNSYFVISNRKPKVGEPKTYNVFYSGDWRCDCESLNKEIYCSHCLALIYRTDILKFRKYMENIPHREINYTKIMDTSVKYTLNELKIGDNEGKKHREWKTKVFNSLRDQGKDVICEAKFNEYNGGGEADIFNVTDNQIIEILSTETIDSFKRVKVSKYPWHLKLDYIKIDSKGITTSEGLKY